MRHYSVKPLALSLRPSRILAGGLAVVGCAGIVLSAMLPLPIWGRGVLMLALLAAMGHAIVHHALLRLPHSINALEVGANGILRCHSVRHGWREAQVLDSSFVTPWLVVMHLQVDGLRWMRPVVILGDILDAELARQLRVWMKWGRGRGDL